jgi:putative glutamine amidotransferase
MSNKPLIGITMDAQDLEVYSKYPWYALRENYCSSIGDEGGIPFPLTHDLNLVEDYISLIDGLVITGGGHDVDPALYGEKDVHPTVKLKPKRTTFEMALAKKALELDIPILGICGGMQLLNVALGGTLIQHIPDESPHYLNHKQTDPRHHPTHMVKIYEDTLLHRLMRVEELSVNSIHHQGVKVIAPGMNVCAVAPDGLIEAIEAPDCRFCLGLQWHPEYLINSPEKALFKAFIEACRG